MNAETAVAAKADTENLSTVNTFICTLEVTMCTRYVHVMMVSFLNEGLLEI